MNRVLIGLLIGMLLASPGFTAQKAWESEQMIVLNPEKHIQVQLQKDFARNAEYGKFLVSVYNRTNGTSAQFHGVCSELVTVNTYAADTRKLDLAQFLNTHAGSDLPIGDVVTAARETLQGQCDQLKVIRLKFRPAHQTLDDYSYEGTLSQANGWRIEDGRVATAFDAAHTFEIAYRDMFSVGGARYKGGCEENPVLTLEPQFANNQERALAKPMEMHHFYAIATDVSKIYAAECQETKKIEFIVTPLPENYRCKEKGDCFLVTGKDRQWEVDSSQFESFEKVFPIADFDDMVEVLAAGRFDILHDYTSFFAFYLETYFGLYSDYCSNYIEDPVGRKVFTINREFDEDGFLVSETIDGPPRHINIERAYASTFDRYFDTWKGWATMTTINRMATSKYRETDPFMAVAMSLGIFTSNVNQLEEMIKGNCTDDRLQTAYLNMYNFANNKPAITGKYTTEKQVLEKHTGPQSSAPEAGKIADQERQRELQSQQQKDQTLAKKRMQQFEEEKAEGIAVHKGSKVENQSANSPPANQIDAQKPEREPLTAHQAQQLKIQEIGQQHYAEMAQDLKVFQQQMQKAETTEERNAIGQKYRQQQQQKNQELQKKLMELRGS